MQMIKKIILVFTILILVGCQSRFGAIEILGNLKVSEISGIYVKANDSFMSHAYLTENDETSIINELKKIKISDLKDIDSEIKDFDYCITIEANNRSYELLIFVPNNLCIDGKYYKIDESVAIEIYNVLNSVSYYEKSK